MVRLDEVEKFKTLDPSGMLGSVSSLPAMLLEANKLRLSAPFELQGKPDQVVICGVGGSAMGGDICRVLLEKSLQIPFLVNRNYELPAWVTAKSLVFVVSYSGETEEALNGFKQAKERGARVVCIASGGTLLSKASENKAPFVKVVKDLQPRAAIAYLTLPILNILSELGLIDPISEQITEAAAVLTSMSEDQAPAKRLAEKMDKKVPIILASYEIPSAAGLRFKNQLNENSKKVAHLSLFSELDHNEIVGLAQLKKGKHPFALVIFRDEKDNERIKKRIEITKSLVSFSFDGVHEVFSQGTSPLARIFSLVYFADLVSVYLAFLNDLDPTPIDVISKLKRELKR